MDAATAHEFNLTSQGACCQQCVQFEGCLAWTYHPPSVCWVTKFPNKPHSGGPGVVSGYLPTPAPAPTPLPVVPKPNPPLGFQPNIVFFLTGACLSDCVYSLRIRAER